MSTNGTPYDIDDPDMNGDNGQSPFDEFLQEMSFNPALTRYVGFEQVVGILMWASMERQLRFYDISTQLDTTSLERIFTAYGAPAEWKPPHKHFAKLSFTWPSEYTLLSISGDEGICSLYHDEMEMCLHEPGTADIFIELLIDYQFPRELIQSLDSDEGVEKTARQVRRAFAELVDHDNIVAVEATAIFSGSRLSLTSIKASHHWTLEEELHDLTLLSEVLLSICDEIRRVLLRFQQEFPGQKEQAGQ